MKRKSTGDVRGTANRVFSDLISPVLWRTMKHATTSVKPEFVPPQPQKISQPHLSDERARELIRRRLGGESLTKLYREYGVSQACAFALTNGLNRAHLLRQVEEGYEDARYVRRGRTSK